MTTETKTARQPLICCRNWTDTTAERRAMWEWQVVHQFAHSRISFTAPTFAERARVDLARAEDLIRRAQEMKWIWTPSAGVWVGLLATRRRR